MPWGLSLQARLQDTNRGVDQAVWEPLRRRSVLLTFEQKADAEAYATRLLAGQRLALRVDFYPDPVQRIVTR